MGWDDLSPAGEVAPVVDGNAAVIADTRQASERYNVLHPFGITLLHSHFHLEPCEDLVEFVDLANWVITMMTMSAGTRFVRMRR
jgi:hypothetical protein